MIPTMTNTRPFRMPLPSYRGLERRARPRSLSIHDRADLNGLELRELPWSDWATWELFAALSPASALPAAGRSGSPEVVRPRSSVSVRPTRLDHGRGA